MFSAMFLSLFMLSLLSGVQADKTLRLALSGPEEVHNVDNFAVVAKVTNTGSETIRLYKDPHSAIDDFPENTFTVTSEEGDTPEFIGAKVKWSYKAATEFITLAPGESHEVTHQLGDAYNFSKRTTYAITPQATLYALPSGKNPYPVPIVASMPEAKHTAKLSGSLISTVVAKRNLEHAEFLQARSLEKRISFSGGCTASQRTTINTAATNALKYTTGAVSYLSGFARTKRYRTWFGAYTISNKNKVLDHFKKIQSGNPKSYKYDCACVRDGVFAYVYSATFGTVYLCPAFWAAPALGTDSKAGTIVHESSHFNRNGGTDDYAYGQVAAAALAVSNPKQAIMNADSHEYFAENTPALP
ncbi:Peptidyl-Lys metalloendopeptidase Short=MEP; AltName: Full=GfMEP; Flags: Precursor [Serendipita indica DSM 11827]|nr:Peptidyl-Lys metalloendopeptidase Short=MEP; AltName: Full=GfMEP; Flags: Precursor [Serendipita indica DSM 11827]